MQSALEFLVVVARQLKNGNNRPSIELKTRRFKRRVF
jgi:hypothetical protein